MSPVQAIETPPGSSPGGGGRCCSGWRFARASATCRSRTIGLWSDGPKSSVPAKVQARLCARQRSRRKGTTLPPKCVTSRGPTSAKPGMRLGPDRIVVTDDGRRLAVQGGGDAQQLAAVQELAVREMDVGEGDLADLYDLAAPARHAAGQGGRRQGKHLRCREIVPAPDRKAVDTARPGQAMIVARHPGEQHVHMLRHFLHEQHVRPLALEQLGDVAYRGPFEPQQIPTDHPHPSPT